MDNGILIIIVTVNHPTIVKNFGTLA